MPAEVSMSPLPIDAGRGATANLIEVLQQIFLAGPGFERLLDGLLDKWGGAR